MKERGYMPRAKSVEWETPQKFFDELNDEFDFTLDPCCSKETAKCEKFYTEENDGLLQHWGKERVFMNPPYSDIYKWTEKAWVSVRQSCEVIVGLLPNWTDRRWFHDWIYPNKAEIRFLSGRVKFLMNGLERKSPSFGSMIVIWREYK